MMRYIQTLLRYNFGNDRLYGWDPDKGIKLGYKNDIWGPFLESMV
jgi:hypothetical protein